MQSTSDLSLPPSAAASPGAWQSLAWRLRQTRSILVAAPLYAIFAFVGLRLNWVHSDVLVTSGIFYILVLGLDLLYGCAGMLSFAHVGFFAVGAYAVAVGTVTHGISPWLAALAGLVINLGLSWVMGRICLRLSGSYFMLGTLAFGIMVHAVITVAHPITGGDVGLGGVPRPNFFGQALGTDASFGALVWGIAALLFVFTVMLTRSGAGRALKAVRSEPLAAASLGTDVARLKTSAFVLSAIYASIGGALFAMYHGAVHPDSFSLGVLLNVLLMLFLGGEGSMWGGLIGATFISVLPDLGGPFHDAKDLMNGVLFSVIILLFPTGVAGALVQAFRRLRGKVPAASDEPAQLDLRTGALPLELTRGTEARLLAVSQVRKRFGGVQAVDGVSFDVPAGSVKGLIGPNGAGKSTLMNLISGTIRLDEGDVQLAGKSLVGLRADQVARAGVLRTFQHEKLFAHLTVEENVMVGYEKGSDGSFLSLLAGGLALGRGARHDQRAREAARGWLGALGLAAYAGSAVSELPTGLRKLVEVARACAAQPRVLLLDETAAGLNETERRAFAELVRRMRAAGLTVVLIEHDIDLVMELCDEICVIDFGRPIADGKPAEIRADRRVIAAYLGD